RTVTRHGVRHVQSDHRHRDIARERGRGRAVGRDRTDGDVPGERGLYGRRSRSAAGYGERRPDDGPNTPRVGAHSAAIRTSGAAARTSASTWLSYLVKFSWNMRTSLRAVSSNSALFCQVLNG